MAPQKQPQSAQNPKKQPKNNKAKRQRNALARQLLLQIAQSQKATATGLVTTPNSMVLSDVPGRRQRRLNIKRISECVLQQAAFRSDPYNYKGPAPCAIGYSAANSFCVIKRARIFVAGTANSYTTFLAFNTSLGAAEDVNSIATSKTAYALQDIDVTNANVDLHKLTGGSVQAFELTQVDTPVSVRCFGVAIRAIPLGPAMNVSGAGVGFQIPQAQPASENVAQWPTYVTLPQITQDYSQDIISFDNIGTCVQTTWSPFKYEDGDFVNRQYFEATALHLNITERGFNLALAIVSPNASQNWIFELVAGYEYGSNKFMSAMTKPGEHKPEEAALIETITRANKTTSYNHSRSVPTPATLAVAEGLGVPPTAITKYLPDVNAVLRGGANIALGLAGSYMGVPLPTLPPSFNFTSEKQNYDL
jgi:hypothetical protein